MTVRVRNAEQHHASGRQRWFALQHSQYHQSAETVTDQVHVCVTGAGQGCRHHLRQRCGELGNTAGQAVVVQGHHVCESGGV